MNTDLHDTELEQSLRTALQETARQMTAAPDAWNEITTQRVRSRFTVSLASAFALATIVALVVGLVAVGREGSTKKVRTISEPVGPAKIVAFRATDRPGGFVEGPQVLEITIAGGGTTESGTPADGSGPSTVCARFAFDGDRRVCELVEGSTFRVYTRADANSSDAVVVAAQLGLPDTIARRFERESKSGRTEGWDPTEVRGHEARWIRYANGDPRSATLPTLTWIERPGVMLQVVVRSDRLDRNDAAKIAAGLEPVERSADELPLVVARGEAATGSWTFAAHEVDGQVCVVMSSRSTGASACETPPASLAASFFASVAVGDGDHVIVTGMVGKDAARVIATPGGRAPIDGAIIGRDARLPVDFFTVRLPVSSTDVHLETFGSDGASLGTFDGSYDVAVSNAAAQEPPKFTGNAVTVAEGDQDGEHWKVVARPTQTGFCAGWGHGDPDPGGNCYPRNFLEGMAMPGTFITNSDPWLVLGLTGSQVAKVRFELDGGAAIEAVPLPAPSGIPSMGGGFVATPTPRDAVVRLAVLLAADGREVGRVEITSPESAGPGG